jgi:hypothetical protein
MARDFLDLLSRLHDHRVDFVIVGGVAAAMHGGTRVTFDLDIVPSLEPGSWQVLVDVLWTLGARPRIPEPLESIRAVANVRQWHREKNMLALNFRSPDGSVEVDLLVSESDRLAELKQRALSIKLDERTFFVASIDDLITMKKRAGRPQDLFDIAQLEDIQLRSKPA